MRERGRDDYHFYIYKIKEKDKQKSGTELSNEATAQRMDTNTTKIKRHEAKAQRVGANSTKKKQEVVARALPRASPGSGVARLLPLSLTFVLPVRVRVVYLRTPLTALCMVP